MADPFLTDDEVQTLIEARAGAKRLLDELLLKQAEIEAAPPDIAPEKLAQGRAAFQKAIESARRTIHSLEEAMRLAGIRFQ